jgi:colicin import membrane protein
MPTPEEEAAAKLEADRLAAEAAKKEPVTPPAEAKKTEEHMIPKSRLDEEIGKRDKAEKELQKLKDEDEKRKREALSAEEKKDLELSEAKQKAAALELKDMQRTAADKVGLPAEFADRLKGKDIAEMEADALKLLEAMPKPDKKKQEKINNSSPAGSEKEAADMSRDEKNAFLFGNKGY